MKLLQSRRICKILGKNISVYRGLAGLSKFDFAIEARLEVRRLNAIESGCANPELETLARISDALNVPLSALFCEQPVKESTFPLSKYQPAFDRITPVEQKRALKVLRVLCHPEQEESLL